MVGISFILSLIRWRLIFLSLEIIKLFNYSPDYTLRGFSNISDDRLKEFYNQYDDLYSILQRIKRGEKIEKKNAYDLEQPEEVLSKVQET